MQLDHLLLKSHRGLIIKVDICIYTRTYYSLQTQRNSLVKIQGEHAAVAWRNNRIILFGITQPQIDFYRTIGSDIDGVTSKNTFKKLGINVITWQQILHFLFAEAVFAGR